MSIPISSINNLTNQEKINVIDEVSSKGFIVHLNQSDTLLLDLDSNAANKIYAENFALVKEAFKLDQTKIDVWLSKSGNNHVSITDYKFNQLSLAEKLLVEVCLGSDPKRALLGWIGNKFNGVDYVFTSMLFEPPEKDEPF